MEPEPVDEAHPHTTDERSDATVVVMVREVEEVDVVVGAPIGGAGLDDGIEIGGRPRLVDADIHINRKAMQVQSMLRTFMRNARMFAYVLQGQLKAKDVISASRY